MAGISENVVFKNLKDFRDSADEVGIKYWLCEGLLLGIYRDGGPIEGDEDDTDIGIEEISEDQRIKLLTALNKRGLKTCLIDGKDRGKIMIGKIHIALQVERGGNRIDVMIMRETKGVAWAWGGNEKESYYLVFPAKFFQKQGVIEWRGEKFKTVNNIEKFLDYKYGDWRVPVLRKHGYDYKNRILNRAYIEKWKPGNKLPE